MSPRGPQGPRRPSTSRVPTSRPRRLAGRAAPGVETGDLPLEPAETAAGQARTADPLVEPVETTAGQAPTADPPVELVETTAAKAPAADPPVEPVETTAGQARTADPPVEPVETTAAEAPAPGPAALLESRRATRVLVAAVVVLAVAAGALFAWDRRGGEDAPGTSDQPVLLSGDDSTAAVAAAAEAATTIFTRTTEGYDEEIDAATELMTDEFAEEFRQTAGEVREDFVAARTEQQVRVVAQGVTRATRTEVQALLFMNYYVSKDGGDTTYTPYRALVTVVHTERGWLVSDVDTR